MLKVYKYKHLHFKPIELEPEKTIWRCFDNDSQTQLADLGYYDGWKQYVVTFSRDAVFKAACLADIRHFLELLNKHKEALE